MRARIAVLLAGFLALGSSAAHAQSGNRSWWGEVRLVGPLAAVAFDCGPDGMVHLEAPLVAGEDRVVAIPFPLRLPLGAAELARLDGPPAQVILSPSTQGAPASAGRVEWQGWIERQPSARFDRLPLALRARSRAAAPLATPRAGAPELIVSLGALLVIVAVRRNPLLVLLVGAAGGAATFSLGLRRAVALPVVEVLEVDLDADAAFRYRSTRRELALPPERLEVVPELAPLRFDLVLQGGRIEGVVRPVAGETGAFGDPSLFAVSVAPVERWSRSDRALRSLERVWVRGAQGPWSARGRWGAGDPLPAPTPALVLGEGGEFRRQAAPGPPSPPGWLAAGVPPGKGALIGRGAGTSGAWIRAIGF